MKFIEQINSLSGEPEYELAEKAFDEFKRLSVQDSDSAVNLDSVKNAFAVLAIALKWVERPRVYRRIANDEIQIRDSIG